MRRNTLGEYIEERPAACPNGHDWNRPDSHLVGWAFDRRHRGHRTWECLVCGVTVHARPGESLLG
jgi:hypothetical protein